MGDLPIAIGGRGDHGWHLGESGEVVLEHDRCRQCFSHVLEWPPEEVALAQRDHDRASIDALAAKLLGEPS